MVRLAQMTNTGSFQHSINIFSRAENEYKIINHLNTDRPTDMKYFVLTCALFFSAITVFAENRDSALIIDVRTPAEWETGHLPGAKHIEWQVIDKKITDLTENKNATIYVYCRSGNRSGKAKKILDQLGYTNVINAGGIREAEAFINALEN